VRPHLGKTSQGRSCGQVDVEDRLRISDEVGEWTLMQFQRGWSRQYGGHKFHMKRPDEDQPGIAAETCFRHRRFGHRRREYGCSNVVPQPPLVRQLFAAGLSKFGRKTPGSISKSIVPQSCCFTTMSWLIERPSPVPRRRLVVTKKGLNIFSIPPGQFRCRCRRFGFDLVPRFLRRGT